jgi:hypothetical protein
MQLPDYKMVQGGNTRVNMSAGAASQVGKAFASMGKDLEGAGMQVSGMFEEAERQHNIGKMADLQLELDQTRSEYDQKMMSDPNGAVNWRQGWTDLMDKKQKEIDARDMSGTLRDQTNLYFKKFSGKEGISVSHKAHTTMLTNARDSVVAVITDRRIKGDFDGADAHVDKAVAEGLMTTSAGQEQKLANARGRKQQNIDNMIIDAPYDAASAFETMPFDTPTARQQAKLQALQQQDLVERLATDEINDRIRGGEDVTNDEIAEAFHPSATKAIGDAIEFRRDYNNLTTQAKIAMPEYQTQLKGQIHAMFAQGVDVKSSGFQYQRSAIVRLTKQVTDDADREEFDRMLARADKGEVVANTALSKVLAQANTNGTLPVPKMATKDVKYKEYLQKGFLNKEKLLELYKMTPTQAADIDKLSSNREYAEAATLLKKTVNNIKGDSKVRAFSPFEKNFYGGLVFGEKLPSFEKVAHTESGTPEQISNFEKSQRIYGKRSAIILDAINSSFAGQDLSKVPTQQLNDVAREVMLVFDDKHIQDILDKDDRDERKTGNFNYKATPQSHLPSLDDRVANWKNKEYFLSADANFSKGVPVIPPLIIVPEGAPPELMRGANIYASEMLELHKEIDPENRKDFKAQVITSGSKMGTPKEGEEQKFWNGKQHVTHLEGFAITDKKMVAFLKTKQGKARYRQILSKAFGNAHGATIGLPHTEIDSGAEDKSTGDTEVSLAKWLLGDDEPQATESTQAIPSVPQMRLGY